MGIAWGYLKAAFSGHPRYENPEYRARIMEYLAMELSGKTGYRNWVRVWGVGDGSELKEEFEACIRHRMPRTGQA